MVLIKLPGMTFATDDGRVPIYAAVLRVLSGQQLAGPRAEAIARALGTLGTLGKDRMASFERLDVGDVFGMDLHPGLFERLATFPEFAASKPEAFRQVLAVKRANGVSEQLPDFSTAERFAFVVKALSANTRPLDTQFVRGRVYPGGFIFVTWGKPWPSGDPDDNNPNQKTFYDPAGRLYSFAYDERLEAVVQGFRDARGGVILAWATIAIGALALSLPAAVAAAGDAAISLYTSRLAIHLALRTGAISRSRSRSRTSARRSATKGSPASCAA